MLKYYTEKLKRDKVYNMKNRNIIFSPSLFGGSFTNIEKSLQEISDSGATYSHFDVMDGNYVPEISFGLKFIQEARELSKLFFDIHLMVMNPEKFISGFAQAGADMITIHVESTKHIWAAISRIKQEGKLAGIALNPVTPVSSIITILPIIDYVLVMTVNPGIPGLKFIPQMNDKVKELNLIREKHGFNYLIGCDGGIGKPNIKELYDSGLDVAVIGRAFFAAENKLSFLTELNDIVKN